MGLEDPFDASDNVFRTLSLTNAKLIRDAMERSANSLTSLGNEAGQITTPPTGRPGLRLLSGATPHCRHQSDERPGR